MRKLAGAVAAVLVVLLVVGIADESSARKRRKRAASAGPLVAYRVVTGYADTEASPRGFVDLTGAAATVPAQQDGTLIVRFAAESFCYGTRAGYCSVRVMVDGQEASPIDTSGTYFDSTGGGGWQSRAIERSFSGLAKGTHEVAVQWATFGGADTRFDLGAWHMTVESLR